MKASFGSTRGIKKEHKKAPRAVPKSVRAKPAVVKVFSGIESIGIKGDAVVRVLDDGTIVGVEDATQSGSILTLTGSELSFNINNYSGGSGSVMSVNGSHVSIGRLSSRCNTAVINGRTIDLRDLDRLHDKRLRKRAEARVPTTYKLDPSCVISTVSVNDASKLAGLSLSFVGSVFVAVITGSGDITLPRKVYQSLTLSVAGSGDIHGNNASAATAVLTVAGSGDIANIEITGSGVASVAGSGDIKIRARHPNLITKQCAGSGRVSVR